MKVGFTGTRKGMTGYQQQAVQEFLVDTNVSEVHHGDCIGADAEFDRIAESLGIPRVAHPCDIMSQRAYCKAETVLPSERPLTRNKAIVDSVQFMLAAPKEIGEVLRSGTWATIRYARKSARPVRIIFPEKYTVDIQERR